MDRELKYFLINLGSLLGFIGAVILVCVIIFGVGSYVHDSYRYSNCAARAAPDLCARLIYGGQNIGTIEVKP